jgi:hypothetical protein
MPTPSPWTLGDVLDVEYLCTSGTVDASRDREALAREFSPRPLAEVKRGELFYRWLKLRRATMPQLPGGTLDRIFRVARFLAWVLGVAVGASSAGGYLLYFGREPVNPFWFLLWLVLVPLLFSLALIALARAWHDWSGPGALARWLIGAVCRRLPGPARTAWQAWNGTFAKHRDRHAGLVTMPLLGITQRAACGFALGALLALWLRVVFTDIAFGWQSSAGWKMETWHGIAHAIAAPWTWLFPSACPTAEQMRDSHFTFAEGVAAIQPAASQAWWPFLAGCLLVWGAGVRAAFILLIGWKERCALREPNFSHSDANAVHRALTGPLFFSEGATPHPEVDSKAAPAPVHAPGRGWLVLAAENAGADRASIEKAIATRLGGSVAGVHAVAMDDAGANTAALAAVSDAREPVAVVLPAARDPILAVKKTLLGIAAACAGRECVVLLHGDPARLPLWRKFAAAHRVDLEILAAS